MKKLHQESRISCWQTIEWGSWRTYVFLLLYLFIVNFWHDVAHELQIIQLWTVFFFFNCCTVHYGIYILFTHQQMHFLLNLEKF